MGSERYRDGTIQTFENKFYQRKYTGRLIYFVSHYNQINDSKRESNWILSKTCELNTWGLV